MTTNLFIARATRAREIAVLCFVVLGTSPVLAQTDSAVSQDEWQFTGGIYMWGADIGGATITGSEVEVGFDTLVDNLDMAFMGAFAARKNDWLILSDVIFLNLGANSTADVTVPVGPIQVPATTSTNLDVNGWVVHLGGGYLLYAEDKSRLEVIGGVRYLDLSMDLFLELQSLGPGQSRTISDSLTALDGIIGLKGQAPLGDRWYLSYYGDIGAGESELTWQASASVRYQAGDTWDVALGYRHIEWDIDSARVIDDINFSGPTLGVAIHW